jgi:formylglycine-generating enzyme required for sulfatase activity
MIDDAFLRQTAALQANLKMLESQQDALSDFQDMQALRLYKSRLADYIEAHARAGQLPRDPFQIIEQRLIALSGVFVAADQEFQRLKGWKADWLNSVPAVGLAEMQSARTELAERVAEVPRIQEQLGQRLSPLDWDTSSPSVDLHSELLACAQCASGLKIPQKAARRIELYQFTRGEGDLTKKTSSHLTAMGPRIEALIALHADHVKTVADAEHHLSNHDFRKAERLVDSLGQDSFSDVDYTPAESRLEELLDLFDQFTTLESSLDQLLKQGESKATKAKLDYLRGLIEKPDSELGRDCLELLQRMGSRIATAQKARKKSRLMTFAVISLSIVGLVVLSLYVIKENAKAEEARVLAQIKSEIEAGEAKAKAEREAAEAKAQAEAAYAKFSGKRAGEEKVIEITPGVTFTLCWCPAGKFTMGSPKSETNRSDDENQVEVTLSQGFWMAKTEVTHAQWQVVMGNNPSRFEGANRPVENVSWNDAQEFLTKLNVIVGNSDGGQMVLPTEAQWEYACRAGETGPYSGGSIDQVAWYHENSASKTHDVGTKKANTWGLHDMHGNVWEWCADWYASELKGGVDPRGAASGSGRVGRGGSWGNLAISCRVAGRNGYNPSNAGSFIGLRVARSSVP